MSLLKKENYCTALMHHVCLTEVYTLSKTFHVVYFESLTGKTFLRYCIGQRGEDLPISLSLSFCLLVFLFFHGKNDILPEDDDAFTGDQLQFRVFKTITRKMFLHKHS